MSGYTALASPVLVPERGPHSSPGYETGSGVVDEPPSLLITRCRLPRVCQSVVSHLALLTVCRGRGLGRGR